MKNRLVKNKYFYIVVISFILFGLYFIGNKSNVIRMNDNGTVSDNGVIGAYIDGEYSSNIPGKDDGYVVKNIVCDNDATGIWDNDNWGLLTTNMTKKTKCNVYFKKYSNADVIADLAKTDTVNFAVDDRDSNIRYIGANPDNYVYFNCSDYSNQSDSTCEKWRIIGVFNSVTKGDGSKENLIKIIRDESIGNYSWDYTSSGSYLNDWSNATLQIMLNSGAYYKGTTGTYYNGSTTASNVDFTSTGLKNDTTRNAIESVVWNLGGTDAYNTSTANMFYTAERGTTVYSGRPTTWTGKIGLMYPSDYGYATAGGSTTNRSTCLSNSLYYWCNYSDCYNNDYLSDQYQWTLMPSSDNTYRVFYVDLGGGVGINDTNYAHIVHPTLYLKSNITINSGNGSSSSPYQLNL